MMERTVTGWVRLSEPTLAVDGGDRTGLTVDPPGLRVDADVGHALPDHLDMCIQPCRRSIDTRSHIEPLHDYGAVEALGVDGPVDDDPGLVGSGRRRFYDPIGRSWSEEWRWCRRWPFRTGRTRTARNRPGRAGRAWNPGTRSHCSEGSDPGWSATVRAAGHRRHRCGMLVAPGEDGQGKAHTTLPRSGPSTSGDSTLGPRYSPTPFWQILTFKS